MFEAKMKDMALSPARHGTDAHMAAGLGNCGVLKGAQSPKDQSDEKSDDKGRNGDLLLPTGYVAPRIPVSRKLKESVFQTNIDNKRKYEALKRKYYGIEEDYYVV